RRSKASLEAMRNRCVDDLWRQRIAVEDVRPAIVHDIVSAQLGMKEHLQGECSPEGPGPGGAREKAGAKQGLEAVDPIQWLIADRGRPDIEGTRTRSGGREAGDGARIGDDDVDALGTVVVIISAARDLRIIDLGIDPVQVLHDLEIEVGKIGWAPKAD